ncbi:cupin domain-containing protein [Actinomadura luteofluorescens]|uniref:Mannose-6-phosphate isomerase-like protein (Cupin superfamily) n=1 Tax=Actinomadura luteofluorescens TaxID=46163 RepID=A0A7Y9JKU6_9ACTN|nr:cupin domain-containing protein [Actinomadura luteofluorescens]NYD52720.1 mannose-6-phosphate isomerase-like protein (cupin superfamily) [Actinomadura luteofluorescens]
MEYTTVRRVVTGHDAQGRARVVDDRDVEPITSELMPGCAFFRLWGRDERPAFPDDGSPRPAESWYPPRDGSRFMINTVPPGEPIPPADLDTAAALEELERRMPGAMAANEPGAPGMHTTDSIDYVLVVSGEATLELDDGERTVLRAGDVLVQNGTRHAWYNRGTEPCTIVGVAIGADRTRPT